MLTRPQKQTRKRGFVLTLQGWSKLQDTIGKLVIQESSEKQRTIEELSELTELDIRTVARALAREKGVDKRTLERLFRALNLKLDKGDYSKPDCEFEEPKGASVNPRQDLREAVDVSIFYGRTEELAKLEQWLLTDCCRLVALLGMGGIGKTALAAKLVEQVKERFEYVQWLSLHNAPPAEDIVANLIQFLSDEQETTTALPQSFDSRVLRLIDYLRSHRCLLVLDNAEAILCSGGRAGHYRAGYEGYGAIANW